MTTKLDLYRAAVRADEAWSRLLRQTFGKDAGDVRYTYRGQGEPGSALRQAHDEFRRTTEAWRQYR